MGQVTDIGRRVFLGTNADCRLSESARRALLKADFTFDQIVDPSNGQVLHFMVFPIGWKRVFINSHQSSEIHDVQGRRRVVHDTSYEDIIVLTRYRVRFSYSKNVASASDEEKVLFSTEPFTLAGMISDGIAEARSVAEAEAKAFLSGRYPDWKDPGAYWDD
ncbi:hypothetical protein BH09PAT1_BH09PAT1_5090 [soil metagenome]